MLVKTVYWNLAATLVLLVALPPPFRGSSGTGGGHGVQAQELNAPEEWLESMKLAHELVARSTKSKQTKAKAKHTSRHHHHRNKNNPPQLQNSEKKALDQDLLHNSKLLLQKQKPHVVTIPELEDGPGMAVYQKRQTVDNDEYEYDDSDDDIDDEEDFDLEIDQWPGQERKQAQKELIQDQAMPAPRLVKRGRGYPTRLEIEQRATAFKYFRADSLVNEPVNLRVVHEYKPGKNKDSLENKHGQDKKTKQGEAKKIQREKKVLA